MSRKKVNVLSSHKIISLTKETTQELRDQYNTHNTTENYKKQAIEKIVTPLLKHLVLTDPTSTLIPALAKRLHLHKTKQDTPAKLNALMAELSAINQPNPPPKNVEQNEKKNTLPSKRCRSRSNSQKISPRSTHETKIYGKAISRKIRKIEEIQNDGWKSRSTDALYTVTGD